MHWRRSRKCARWILTLAALALVAAWVSCWWIEVAWANRGSTASISLGAGGVYFGWTGGGVDDFECGWQPGLHVERAFYRKERERFPESDYSDPVFAWQPFASFAMDKGRISMGQVFIPLWIPFVGLFPLAGVLYALHVRDRRRGRAGRCLACGYDRTDLAADAKCPECGMVPSPTQA